MFYRKRDLQLTIWVALKLWNAIEIDFKETKFAKIFEQREAVSILRIMRGLSAIKLVVYHVSRFYLKNLKLF